MKKLLFVLLVTLLIIVSGCGQNEVPTKEDGESYTSFLPPKTVEVGETFSVDLANVIRVNDVKRIVSEDLETILIISYDWTNNSNSPGTIGENIKLTLKQKNVTLTPDLSKIDNKELLIRQIGPGETLESIKQGFIAKDTEEIHISFMGKEKTIFIDGRPEKAYPVDLIIDFPSDI